MNYLAHAFLSFQRPGILAGNMISDFVKGKKRYTYPSDVQQGIILHREIDRFTDIHPASRAAREIFRPAYRLYGGAIIDVVFDHFLALDSSVISPDDLDGFTKKTYATLDGYIHLFPDNFSIMYPYMKSQNWLFNYKSISGIRQSLNGLMRRAAYMKESETAFRLFRENYEQIGEHYHAFFPDVKKMAADFISRLENNQGQLMKI